MELTDRVKRAREIAIKAHGDQKYGDQPYVAHLDEVVGILIEYGDKDDDSLCAGYLHDTLEDTKLAGTEILKEFGEAVLFAAQFCTDEKGANRKERKQKTYARTLYTINALWVGTGNPEHVLRGMRVKIADRLANLRSSTRSNPGLLRMYQKEAMDFFWALYEDAVLNGKSGKGLNDDMWLEYERLTGVEVVIPSRGKNH